MKGPAALQKAPSAASSTPLPPASALATGPTAYNASTPLPPTKSEQHQAPPAMFTPTNATGPSPIEVPRMDPGFPAASPLGPPPTMPRSPYALAAAGSAARAPVAGMDPTAPAAADRPLGPPPMGGFYKKN